MKKIILSLFCLSAAFQAFAQYDDVQTTTTTTTTVTDDMGGVNMNVNMGVGGMGTGINVNINDGMGNGQVQQTTTVRQTTTTRSSGGYAPPPPAYNPPPPPPPARPNYGGYTGRIGCPNPMNDGEFGNVLNSITRNDFENTKLSMAKQIIGSRCVTSAQVRSVMQAFEFENSKLEFAKFAYPNTFDIDNYFMVNDAFEFENSKTTLMKSIR
jgi:Domain of unknown function (DUF4476)